MEKESIKHSNKLLQKQEENTYNLCYWRVEVSETVPGLVETEMNFAHTTNKIGPHHMALLTTVFAGLSSISKQRAVEQCLIKSNSCIWQLASLTSKCGRWELNNLAARMIPGQGCLLHRALVALAAE